MEKDFTQAVEALKAKGWKNNYWALKNLRKAWLGKIEISTMYQILAHYGF